MAEIIPQSLKIKDACARTGLSESTIRRRISDGSLPAYQLGGSGHAIRIELDALKYAVKHRRASASKTVANQSDGESVLCPDSAPTTTEPDPTKQRRSPGPKWKRELAALEIFTHGKATE